jgi:formate dehydrogenase subunit gamma
MLHALQAEFGYVDRAAIPLLSETLALSRAEVVGVLDFYHDFRQAPEGRHTLQVCRAEACQSMGCESLLAHIGERLEVALGGTTADGAITLKDVYCLGNCALSPAVMLDERLYGRVSAEKVDRLLNEARS